MIEEIFVKISKKDLAKMIDHTLVKPTATKDEVAKLCEEAEKYRFGSVCVNPTYVSLATRLLKETTVKVCSSVGFPFGVTLPEVKAFEARRAVENGACEIDMVINIGALKSKDYEAVKRDIEAVVAVKRSQNDVVVKVIIETGCLTAEEKVMACKLVKEAGADFVKTSTGFIKGGVTVEDVRLMRETVGEDMGVKAAGGIRTLKQALAMIEAGANRIGTSSGVAIIEGFLST
ncbi:deoxyribose-phosphate aldolase [Candidatus Bathyarchaeota archaeon]|nr:MAG: deoxyribose-phosphate aldolase [Candidatus Bathyarchaeota archaeon]